MKQMQEVAGERGGYLHGRGGIALDRSNPRLYHDPLIMNIVVIIVIIMNIVIDLLMWLLTSLAALDSDDLLYLKEQMEAEEDAERLRRRTEKRAFAAFKISSQPSHLVHWL